jgi:hypothetical protein
MAAALAAAAGAALTLAATSVRAALSARATGAFIPAAAGLRLRP